MSDVRDPGPLAPFRYPPELSALAQRLFQSLPGAGSLPDGPDVLRGEAGAPEAGVHVRIHLKVAGDIVKDARFQAYGCPHTLATVAWLVGQLPGRRLAALVPQTPHDWLAALSVPAMKLGRLLVIEDALNACVRNRAPAAR